MEKIYKYDNATIYVLGLDSYNRERLKKATEVFLKKVLNGGTNDGHGNPSTNFRKE